MCKNLRVKPRENALDINHTFEFFLLIIFKTYESLAYMEKISYKAYLYTRCKNRDQNPSKCL